MIHYTLKSISQTLLQRSTGGSINSIKNSYNFNLIIQQRKAFGNTWINGIHGIR